MGDASDIKKVLIAGAGPVGLFVALQLARANISIRDFRKVISTANWAPCSRALWSRLGGDEESRHIRNLRRSSPFPRWVGVPRSASRRRQRRQDVWPGHRDNSRAATHFSPVNNCTTIGDGNREDGLSQDSLWKRGRRHQARRELGDPFNQGLQNWRGGTSQG